MEQVGWVVISHDVVTMVRGQLLLHGHCSGSERLIHTSGIKFEYHGLLCYTCILFTGVDIFSLSNKVDINNIVIS